jgi:hypothetical protein
VEKIINLPVSNNVKNFFQTLHNSSSSRTAELDELLSGSSKNS